MSQPATPNTISVNELYKMMYSHRPEQTCICCGKLSQYTGWDSLCNRTCYYALNDLLTSFEKGEVAEPDSRLVAYFTKHPEPEHYFYFEKLKKWMSRHTD